MAEDLRAELESALETGRISHAAAAHYIGVSRVVILIWLTDGSPIRDIYHMPIRRFCVAVARAVKRKELPSDSTQRPLGLQALKRILGTI